jgi:DNA-binding PadR family transcriptional regulator
MITARVAYDTFGELDLRPATLHDNLRVLLAKGWITEQPGRNFSLTDNGFSLLQNDLYRWRIVTSRANDTLRSRGSSVLG